MLCDRSDDKGCLFQRTAQGRVTSITSCHFVDAEERSDGRLRLKAGVMGIVLAGGDIAPGDSISVDLPPEPHRPLEKI